MFGGRLCCVLPALLSGVGAAGAADPHALDQFLASTQTLRAQFRQELRDNGGQVLEVSAGTVLIKRPNRFQWSYQEPFEQLVLADGERLWVYDKDLAQASVAPIGTALTATPAMLLSGEGLASDEFNLQASFSRDGLDWVLLKPKAAAADFRTLALAFAGDTLRFMELQDNLEQVTFIEFSDIERNVDLTDDLFRFEPPPGVDVIGAET